MKRLLLSLFVLWLILLPLAGSNSSDTRRQLVDIRSYISADPSRALHELEAIDAASLSEGDAALYAVLLTQAADKCLITHTSDSLILTAVDYYSHAGRDKEDMQHWFCKVQKSHIASTATPRFPHESGGFFLP